MGLLGVAALQLVSLKTNQEALVRVKASSLANAMLERIRANRVGFLEGAYDEVEFNAEGFNGSSTDRDLSVHGKTR